MNEENIIESMVFMEIEHFKKVVSDHIRSFYKRFDPVKSLNKGPVIDIIAKVHFGLDDILEDLK